ncbi:MULTISPECIES: hypothetical protein [Streptomyces]|uniref:hypothetical protein n=1 Tax=Streptomyces TaxID=1883 RepID=UPI0036FB8439
MSLFGGIGKLNDEFSIAGSEPQQALYTMGREFPGTDHDGVAHPYRRGASPPYQVRQQGIAAVDPTVASA